MTRPTSKKLLATLSRREVFQAGGMATAWSLLGSSPSLAKTDGSNVYSRIGVRPFHQSHGHLYDQRWCSQPARG